MEDKRPVRKKSKRVLSTINAKTNGAYLGALLRRRRAAKRIAETSFDRSVPSSLHITNATSTLHLPIHQGPVSRLSPFIVHLDRLPEPAEILEQEAIRSLRINLLQGRPVHVPEIGTVDELALAREEVASQLSETILENFPSSPWIIPRLSSFLPRLSPAPPEILQHERLSSRHALPGLRPPAAPANLYRTFDLPELEDEEEAEDVVLEHFKVRPASTRPHLPRILFGLPQNARRAVGVFVLLSFVFVLPLHAMRLVGELRDASLKTESSGASALSALSDGAEAVFAKDSAAAKLAFGQAGRRLGEAQETVTSLGASTDLLLSVIPATKTRYRSGQSLLETGAALARAGERLSDGLLAIERQPNPTTTTRLAVLSSYARSALPSLEEANRALRRVDEDAIPDSHRPRLQELAAKLPALIGSLKELLEFGDLAHTILGGDGAKRYLLVFQNNTELRATGGFMGSFAEVELTDGEVTGLRVPGGGTYDLQGSFRRFLTAPEPLRLINARWEFQDANWFPDFPTSARQMMEMYEEAGSSTVDGVIAVNASVMVELLNALGPVDMPAYGRKITAANFLLETQKIVELEYDREENKPKAFIGDLANELLARSKSYGAPEFFSILDVLNQSLTEKDIQLYLRNEDLERRVRSLGWSGEIRATEGDYLLVVNSNLGGGKTDGVMEEQVDVQVEIAEDGTILNTVTVERTHFGTPRSLFTGVNNVDYLRLYVPKGSELLSASGFSIPDRRLFDDPGENWEVDEDLLYAEGTQRVHPESRTDVYEEQGKTVFGNWVQTKPGTTSKATFTYRLPWKLATAPSAPASFLDRVKRLAGLPTTERYTLTVQKQSGVLDRTTTVRVRLPERLQILWASDDPNSASFTNRTDGFFGLLLEPSPSPRSL